MKYILVVLILLSTIVLAHEHEENATGELAEHEYSSTENFGPVGGPNDISRLLPWTYAAHGDYVMTIVISLLWLVTVVGIGRLLILVIGRLLK